MRLVLTKVEDQIRKILLDHANREIEEGASRETGVTLFGERAGDDFLVLGIAGPGPDALHEQCEYSGNEDYATMVFEGLKKDNPNIKHLGELHTHPFRMSKLSGTDREQVKTLLKDYEEFIAGVILHGWQIDYYPIYFSRENPQGTKMEVVYERSRRWRWLRRKRIR
jgi:integrative and conjugative element protein (TIGR02256 family)